jgi:hypothetical protein
MRRPVLRDGSPGCLWRCLLRFWVSGFKVPWGRLTGRSVRDEPDAPPTGPRLAPGRPASGQADRLEGGSGVHGGGTAWLHKPDESPTTRRPPEWHHAAQALHQCERAGKPVAVNEMTWRAWWGIAEISMRPHRVGRIQAHAHGKHAECTTGEDGHCEIRNL